VGASRREKMVEGVVDSLGPLPHGHRFTAFGAARLGILETASELGRVYPQINKRIQAHFGMSGWNGSGGDGT
jgi:hypothetical protein